MMLLSVSSWHSAQCHQDGYPSLNASSRIAQIERNYEGWVGVCLQVSLFYPGILMAIFTGASSTHMRARQARGSSRYAINTAPLSSDPHYPSPAVLNVFIKHTGSTGAVPATTYFLIVLVWFAVSIPLTFIGGCFARTVRNLLYKSVRVALPAPIADG